MQQRPFYGLSPGFCIQNNSKTDYVGIAKLPRQTHSEFKQTLLHEVNKNNLFLHVDTNPTSIPPRLIEFIGCDLMIAHGTSFRSEPITRYIFKNKPPLVVNILQAILAQEQIKSSDFPKGELKLFDPQSIMDAVFSSPNLKGVEMKLKAYFENNSTYALQLTYNVLIIALSKITTKLVSAKAPKPGPQPQELPYIRYFNRHHALGALLVSALGAESSQYFSYELVSKIPIPVHIVGITQKVPTDFIAKFTEVYRYYRNTKEATVENIPVHPGISIATKQYKENPLCESLINYLVESGAITLSEFSIAEESYQLLTLQKTVTKIASLFTHFFSGCVARINNKSPLFPIPKWALFLIIGDLNRHPLNHVYSAYSVKAPECILLNTLLHWLTQSPDELAQREKREITGKIQQLKLACVEAVPSIRIDPLELVLLPSSPASRQNLVKSVE